MVDRASFLIEPNELLACMREAPPFLIDARTPQAYTTGHLPQAHFLSTYGCFVPDTTPAGMAAFARDVAARYAAIGVTHKRPVVVYEDDTGMRAARELWILEYLGHKQVRMLHGGLRAWRAAGGEVATDFVMPRTAAFEPVIRGDIFVSADEVHAGLAQAGRQVIDVRDTHEYHGRDETPCCARRGHLPGAVWVEWSELLDNGRYKSPQAICDLLRGRGIDEASELVPYCHRGARSANTYYALRYAGYTQVRNYIGSFHDWSARADLPVEI